MIVFLLPLLFAPVGLTAPEWTAPHRYRVLIEVEASPRRGSSVASLEVDFAAELKARGAQGTFDEATIEVIGYDGSGRPQVFDKSQDGRDRHLAAWRLDRSYGTSRVMLRFVLAKRVTRRYAVYIDTRESGLGRPRRYPGIVGDGDLFTGPTSAARSRRAPTTRGATSMRMGTSTSSPAAWWWDATGNARTTAIRRGCSAGSSRTSAAGRRHGSRRGTRRSGLRTPRAFSPATASGRTVCAPSTGTRTAAPTSWWAIRMGSSGCPATPTGALFPAFAPGERLRAAGQPIKVYGEAKEARLAGYARVDVADWNGDGRKDLVVADGRGWVWLFLDGGRGPVPALGRGRRSASKAGPISGTGRGSVLVRDWDGDGRLDLLFAMVGEAKPDDPAWPPRHADPSADRGFLYYRNVGTRTAPVLAPPKWIKAGPGPTEIDLLRPNLGAFVDWNGDGRRDFIACEFENNCRVWRRTDAAEPGMKPQFGGPVEGEVILEPWTHEMISGVDALDWDGDGSIDLLTGQGHGGSGIRYYRRGYLDDIRAGSLPKVTIDRAPDPLGVRP